MPSSASTSWQKPCVVAIVRRVEVGDRAGEPVAPELDLVRGRPWRAAARRGRLSGVDHPGEMLESACSQPTSRSRTRSRSSPVAIRVNVISRISLERHALRDVTRGERRDRVRLARPGARLEHRDPGWQRPAQVELGTAPVAGHRSLQLLDGEQAVPQPVGESPNSGCASSCSKGI